MPRNRAAIRQRINVTRPVSRLRAARRKKERPIRPSKTNSKRFSYLPDCAALLLDHAATKYIHICVCISVRIKRNGLLPRFDAVSKSFEAVSPFRVVNAWKNSIARIKVWIRAEAVTTDHPASSIPLMRRNDLSKRRGKDKTRGSESERERERERTIIFIFRGI